MSTSWCLLFDCDGTLVDSEPLLARELAQTFTGMGLPFTADDYIHRYRGTHFKTIMSKLEAHYQRKAVLARPLDVLEAEMRTRLLARIEHELAPIAGVHEALQALPSFARAVASNGPLNKIKLSMRVSGLGKFFDEHLYSAYDVGHWKPDPELFLYAARALSMPPERCIVIDDALVGVQAGLDAGMHVVHYRHHPEEFTPPGAYPLAHMQDLPELVSTITAQSR